MSEYMRVTLGGTTDPNEAARNGGANKVPSAMEMTAMYNALGRVEDRIRIIDDQLTTLIREVAAWRAHKSINPISLIDAPISRAIRATNAHHDLQARIAAEMERK